MKPNKQELLQKIQDYCNALTKQHKEQYPSLNDYWTFKEGKKFIKVIDMMNGKYASVWCFIDYEGNLYKANSWNAPAKDIRGHIDNPIMSLRGFYK